MPLRRCHDCRRKLPLDSAHFAPYPTCRDGYSAHCRPCLRARKRDYARASRERKREPVVVRHRPLAPGQICPECFGLGHRRPFAGCPRCKLAHVPLPPVESVTRRSYEPAVAV